MVIFSSDNGQVWRGRSDELQTTYVIDPHLPQAVLRRSVMSQHFSWGPGELQSKLTE